MEQLEKILEVIMTKQIFGSALVILISYILIYISKGFISKILVTGKTKYEIKRRKTIINLFQSLLKYIIMILALLIILSFYGVDTKSLITSLGVVGVVLGLAMQDTVKDFIGGITLILENYLAVGDIVTYQDFTGEVIELGLRTVKIKGFNGEVLVISNRNIDTIKNSSQKSSNLYIEIDTAYEEKCSKVEKVLKEVLEKAIKEKLIFPDSEYLGINELGSSSVKYVLNVHCDQAKKFQIRRDILKMVKEAYEKNNIKIPYPQIEVHNGQEI